MPVLPLFFLRCGLRAVRRVVWLLLLVSGVTVGTMAAAVGQTVEICNNGIDDDGDNLIDCQDPDCPECIQAISCSTPNTNYMPPTYGNPTSAQSNQFGSHDLVLSTSAAFTTVRIRTPDNSFDKTVVVTSTGPTIVSLPVSLTGGQTVVMTNSVNTIQRNKGLIITSAEPVQATYRLTAANNQDIVPLKGRAAQGYAFYAGSQTRLTATTSYDYRHFVSVMATQDNTVVTFRLPPSAGAPASVTALEGITTYPHTVTLNANDSYLVSSKVINSTTVENRSMAGVLVTSNLPIVVNSGSQHNDQPYSGNKDAGIDQLVPVRTIGQEYIAVHGQNTTSSSDYVFVVGTEKNTTVTISGPASANGTITTGLTSATVNPGEVFTYNLPNYPNRAFSIVTSKRAYTYQISSYGQNEFGMGVLPTINPCNGSKRIDFFRTSASSLDQALITIPQTGLASLKFRGQGYAAAGGIVVDNIIVGGIPQAIVNFPNTAIAPSGSVNTTTSSERFHVGVVSNTGSNATGNFGFYSNYDARVDVLSPTTNQPDNFYTAAKVTPGQSVTVCLRMTSCGTRNQITGIGNGALTQSATFTQDSCILYTMQANAPSCSRDTIRVLVQNDIGKLGSVCLEFVNVNTTLAINILPASVTICQPVGAVSLTANATSSNAAYTYQWITPDNQILTTKVISATVVGRYNLSISNASGCSDTTSVVVQGDTPFVTFTGGTTNACPGTSAVYSFSSSPGTYVWAVTNGTITAGGSSTSTTATVRWTGTSGTIRATVTSALGCIATQLLSVTSQPTLSVVNQSPKCFGGSDGQVMLTVTGGAPVSGYRWSTGATTQNLTAVPTGAYSVTVTTTCPTTVTLATTLTQPTALTLATTTTNASCTATASGVVSVTASGGTSGYTYRWSTLATTQSLTGLTAGTYSVTVTDANSCPATTSATVVLPAVTLTTQLTNVACFGGLSGAISVTAVGTSPYSYSWTTGATTRNLAGLASGTYSLTVTDNSLCRATTSVTLTQPTAISLSAQGTAVRCYGGNNGAIDLTVGGGVPTYSFSWNTGASTEDLTGLVAGPYSVTVTDRNTCVQLLTVTVSQPSALPSVTAGSNSPQCAGQNLSLTATSSTAVTFTWSGPASFTSAAQNPFIPEVVTANAGSYTVTVTDAAGCLGVGSVSIVVNPSPVYNLSTRVSACLGATALNNGRLIVDKQQATDRYAYTIGTTYTGVTDPQGLPAVPADGVLTRSLTNPASAQPYTVRVFNTIGCYTDLAVRVAPVVCVCNELCAPTTVRRVP